MSHTEVGSVTAELEDTSTRMSDRVRRLLGAAVRHPATVLACLFVMVVVSWALFPGLTTHADPLRADASQSLLSPRGGHLLGTDQLGRDIYARVVSGAALTLRSTLAAVGIGVLGGSLLGLVSGYFGGFADAAVMRLVDVVLSLPVLLMSMMLVTAIGFGSGQLSIAVGVSMVGSIARITRSQVVRLREATYVDAARSFGAGPLHIIRRHIAPEALAPVLALAVLEFGQAVLAIAALSFLGYGSPPPTPEWGSLVAAGQPYLGDAWWVATGPGLLIALLVICVNQIARELRGVTDVR